MRYGLAVVSVAAARALTQAFLHFHLPQPFTALALSAIAITFWFAGTMPGILAAFLATLVRSHFFEPDVNILARALYDLVFLLFALLMTRATQTRNELEMRVAERTAELTHSNEELKLEISGRKQAEKTLRESEAYLAEAQRLSHTGSLAWAPATGEIRYWSQECYQVLGFDPRAGLPRFETVFRRIRADDQGKITQCISKATLEKAGFEFNFRIVHPDGEMRDIHAVGHPILSPSGDLSEFVGTVIDITERKQAEEERERLRQVQADLALINRVTIMEELAASLAHEMNQPIAAALTDANTCLRWLTRDHPDVGEARLAVLRIVKDGTRAAEIVSRIRLLFKKSNPERVLVDVNEVIRETIALLHSEVARHSISVRTELTEERAHVAADRVELQQVMMNLFMNSIEAMKDVNVARALVIRSKREENEQLLISISDTGVGLPMQQTDDIFNAFFTTKPHGVGMGLQISRSIVESHGGRLWAEDNMPRGASFHFTLPTKTGAN
jgi:PAS domain S-box-containing protein